MFKLDISLKIPCAKHWAPGVFNLLQELLRTFTPFLVSLSASLLVESLCLNQALFSVSTRIWQKPPEQRIASNHDHHFTWEGLFYLWNFSSPNPNFFYSSSFSLVQLNEYIITYPFIIYGHVSCFQYLTTMKNVTINTWHMS